MNTMKHVATHDLSNGWFVSHRRDDEGVEEMTFRNGDLGMRIDLSDTSVKTLREICRSVKE